MIKRRLSNNWILLFHSLHRKLGLREHDDQQGEWEEVGQKRRRHRGCSLRPRQVSRAPWLRVDLVGALRRRLLPHHLDCELGAKHHRQQRHFYPKYQVSLAYKVCASSRRGRMVGPHQIQKIHRKSLRWCNMTLWIQLFNGREDLRGTKEVTIGTPRVHVLGVSVEFILLDDNMHSAQLELLEL